MYVFTDFYDFCTFTFCPVKVAILLNLSVYHLRVCECAHPGLYEYVRNARLEEAQAGITIARRNINNLRYADDTTVMEESEEELKNLLRKVKEESEKVGLKLNVQKPKIIMVSSLITLWQIDGETMKTMTDSIFLGSRITADGDCNHEIKR